MVIEEVVKGAEQKCSADGEECFPENGIFFVAKVWSAVSPEYGHQRQGAVLLVQNVGKKVQFATLMELCAARATNALYPLYPHLCHFRGHHQREAALSGVIDLLLSIHPTMH